MGFPTAGKAQISRKRMGRGSLLAVNFLKNLDAGTLVDRRLTREGGKKLVRTNVPSGMKALMRVPL